MLCWMWTTRGRDRVLFSALKQSLKGLIAEDYLPPALWAVGAASLHWRTTQCAFHVTNMMVGWVTTHSEVVMEGLSEKVIFRLIPKWRGGSRHVSRWEKGFLLKEIASIVSPESNQVRSVQHAWSVIPDSGIKWGLKRLGDQNIRTLHKSGFYIRYW